MGNEIPESLRWRVSERADHLCEYCLVHKENVYHGCEVDHIVSLKHGGLTVPDNLAYACFHCNRHKGTDLGSLNPETGAFVRFYNPRTDQWAQHFSFWQGRIEPLTAIGEVTVRVLDFNHPERVALRKLLADTGRYPTVAALARMREG
ncbi:MAG: HNH endonuclease [Verrucomicrobia bacterium]|nr:HNH endonuclease [Verrucomicrobiota bacterium]